MNNGAQGGQSAQGQPSSAQQQQQQQQKRQIPLFKPDQMRNLPDQFSAEDKLKWEQGLRALWGQIEKFGPETPQHQEAKRKLFEFSRTLTTKLHNARVQQQQQQNGGSQARPPSQGQPTQSGESSAPNPNAAQQPRPQPKISPKVMEHVSNFPYVLPPHLAQGSPEALKWLQDAKNRYLKALVAMETARERVGAIEAVIQKRNDEGKPLSPEEEKDLKEKKDVVQKTHAEAKNFVDGFRQQQAQLKQANAQAQGNAPQSAGGANTNNAGQAPARPQMNPQQVPNPASQNTQTINAAIEAARNQQMGGARTSISNGQISQPPQLPGQVAASQMVNMPPQGGQQPNIKTEAGVPAPLNTAITQMQGNQGRSMQNNSPQSAVPRSAGPPQSATSQNPNNPNNPVALSHSDALHHAARSYSSGQPSVMGHSHPSVPQPRESSNIITNKMPIPKHLPERAAAPPTPVQINQSRPTYSGGPSNVGNGVISQPVLAKTPGYNMEGEGDRVLSKKKLDELVRQVTGGGQGLEDGMGLTPDVEEVRYYRLPTSKDAAYPLCTLSLSSISVSPFYLVTSL
jgi:transcription initiation factor TFIID subunit 12